MVAAWQQLRESEKESPWGAGSVQIESTCRSLGSQLKRCVGFWLSGSLDTSYINLGKTRKKNGIKCAMWATGGPDSFPSHVTR